MRADSTAGVCVGLGGAGGPFGRLTIVGGKSSMVAGRMVQTMDSRYPTCTDGDTMAKQIEGVYENVLRCARREFLEKGFKDASLRAVVKEAGFTQGAFYGYYDSKEALFDALVSPAADGLLNQFKQAQQAHYELIPEDKAEQSRDLSTSYLNYFINYIYDHFDVFKLVICCSEGTRYANYVHELVELEVNQTEDYYRQLRQLGKLEGTVSRDLHHMITSAYFTAVFETVAHDMTREQAIGYVNELAVFFNCGWNGLLRFK